jgi:hypothetical protein
MSFYRKDNKGKIIRKRVTIDCQKAIEEGEIVRVEQAHKDEVNINNIVKKHGLDMIAKTAAITPLQYWDDDPDNDFQEYMNKIAQGEQTFASLPSEVRREFDNNPAKYMDYVLNPDNKGKLIERGWMNAPEAPPEPVQVVVTNPETPPPDGEAG